MQWQGFFCYTYKENMPIIPKTLKYREVSFPLPLDPFTVFSRIVHHSKIAFLLESLGPYSDFSRFTYIGFDPAYHIISRDNQINIKPKLSFKKNNLSPFEFLEAILKEIKHLSLKKGIFCGGLVGYFSHEATKYFEPAFVGESHPYFPDFEVCLYLDGLCFDKQNNKFIYFFLDENRQELILDKINKPNNHNNRPFSYTFLGKNKSKSQYEYMFKQAKEAITAGKIFQIVLSIKNYYQLFGDPLALYQQLRLINPSPHMYYLKFGHRHIIGASPELLIRLKGKHLEHFGTLAGTIKRGSSLITDKKLEKILQTDEKERAEHLMLVDLARNDVGRICKFGTVKVKNLLTVKKFSHVQHLFTSIYGQLNDNENAFSALAACFPAGTLTGAPKIEAMKIIKQLEEDPRGPYGGVVGYFSLNGDCMFAINIRSIYIAAEQAYSQVGSGIVYDSQLEKEYQEIENKHQAMRLALEQASKTDN